MSEWIRVEDGMPEGKVLISYGQEMFGSFSPEAECAYYDEESEKWLFWLSDREVHTNGVTHWMPLPEPPEPVNQVDAIRKAGGA